MDGSETIATVAYCTVHPSYGTQPRMLRILATHNDYTYLTEGLQPVFSVQKQPETLPYSQANSSSWLLVL